MPSRKAAGAQALAISDSAAFIADLKRREFNSLVNNECDLYRNTGDGRFLWRAYLRLHEAGAPIPQNFLDKFAEWAHKVLDAESPKEIAVALELAGTTQKHSGRKQGETYRRNWLLGSEVEQVRQLWKISLEEAFRIVARNRRKPLSVVKKAYDMAFRAPVREQRQEQGKKRAMPLQDALGAWHRK